MADPREEVPDLRHEDDEAAEWAQEMVQADLCTMEEERALVDRLAVRFAEMDRFLD